MTISWFAEALGPVTALALVTGCASGSVSAPPLSQVLGVESTSVSSAGPFAPRRLLGAELMSRFSHIHRGEPMYAEQRGGCPARSGSIFASDNVSGDLDVYCGPGQGKVPVGEKAFLTVRNAAGWGLAVAGKELAVGVSGGTIAIYTLPTLGTPHVLTLSHGSSGYDASGLSWDSRGGLYATEFQGPYVDYYANPMTQTSPSCTYMPLTLNFPYSLAAEGSSVDVYGYDGFASQVPAVVSSVVGIPACAGEVETPIVTLGSLGDGTGFPGGLTLNQKHRLVANDQYGTLDDLGHYPGTSPPVGSCSWGFNPNDFTDIAFDVRQSGIWAANINFARSSIKTYLVDNSYPLNEGTCTTPGPAGGPTFSIPNEEYVGVAVSRYDVRVSPISWTRRSRS